METNTLTTKLIQIDACYHAFPEGMETIEEFIEFVNNHEGKFIKMTRFNEAHCVAPYFIEEDSWPVWVNLSTAGYIYEVEGQILPRSEYEARLREVVREKCLDCVRFDGDPDNLDGHCEILCLDGTCCCYKKCEEE